MYTKLEILIWHTCKPAYKSLVPGLPACSVPAYDSIPKRKPLTGLKLPSLHPSLTCQPHFQGEWVWEVTPHFRSAWQNLGRANENGVLNHVTDIM